MPPLKAKLLALALAVSLALGLAACGGGSDLLPGTTATEINSNLEEVKELVSENDCAGAQEAVAEVRAQVEGLKGVDARLVEALGEGAAQLEAVVSGCEEEPEVEEEETEPLEEAEEAEEKPEKQEKERPEKEEEPAEEEGAEKEPPTTPAETPGHEKQEEEPQPTPEESQPPSGGVGPGAAVGEG